MKYIIGKADVIESVDSLKLAREIEKQAARHNICQKVLIELKISDDPNKTGLPLNELDELIGQIEQMEHIEWKGLMCIASHTEDLEKVGKEFETMHDLYLALQKKYPQLDTLSMGMSQDYQIAIEHGSNMVRIGTALFD